MSRSLFRRLIMDRMPGIALLLTVATGLFVIRPASAAEFMFRATVDGQTIEGKPLAWSASEMLLLGRDGWLHQFDPRKAKQAKKTGPRFVGYTFQEMKGELYGEFGEKLAITTTKHYLVVHPPGQSNAWAGRFEELYRWCLSYFRVRGFQSQEPEFPLVAVVFRNRGDYFQAAVASGRRLSPNTVGHYDPDSNRVLLYDSTAGRRGGDWTDNADTIIHEATHQTAYNVGIHNRFAEQPRWLIEGLATMFEARGVWNSQSYHSLKDRLNVGRLSDFKRRVAKDRPAGTMANSIASDRMFQSDAVGAYAEAWALSFYLSETRPRQYIDYLAMVASRPMLSKYSAAERVADFQTVFGSDLKQFEASFLTWIAEIK